MKRVAGILVAIVLLLLMMIGTAALTVWFMGRQQLRPATPSPPDSPGDVAGNSATGTADTTRVPAEMDRDLDWNRAEIQELRDTVENDTIAKLMELLRTRNGFPVNYEELMQASGRTMPQVRADLAKLSRISHGINNHGEWPIEVVAPTEDSSNRAYTIPVQYLDWWFED